MADLIWIQIVWHSDSVPERILLEKLILQRSQQKTKSMKNYPACIELNSPCPKLQKFLAVIENDSKFSLCKRKSGFFEPCLSLYSMITFLRPLKYHVFENIMENRAIAHLEQMLHFA